MRRIRPMTNEEKNKYATRIIREYWCENKTLAENIENIFAAVEAAQMRETSEMCYNNSIDGDIYMFCMGVIGEMSRILDVMRGAAGFNCGEKSCVGCPAFSVCPVVVV